MVIIMTININNNFEQDIYSSRGSLVIIENQILKNTSTIMHYHDVIEIGIVLKGSGTFLINDKICNFNKDNVSIIFPNDIHISRSNANDESEWTYILIDIYSIIQDNPYIFSSVSRKLYDGILPSRIYSNRNSKRVINIVQKLCRELQDKSEGYSQMSSALCAELLIEISRNYEYQTPSMVNKGLYEKISPAITHIMRFYDENITVKELSGMCFLSETHFRRIFKTATGFSPLDYIYRIRISAAKSLLKTNTLSILQICNTVGYNSQTSFNKHFKHYVGITPSEYLHNITKQNDTI